MYVKAIEPIFNSGGYCRGRTPVYRGVLERESGRGECCIKEGFNQLSEASENCQSRGKNFDGYC